MGDASGRENHEIHFTSGIEQETAIFHSDNINAGHSQYVSNIELACLYSFTCILNYKE